MDAKALAAAKLRAADHHWTHAATHALRSKGGAERARQKPNELGGLAAPPAAKLEGEADARHDRGNSGVLSVKTM